MIVNLGNMTGSVAPGDEVIAGTFVERVTRVTINPKRDGSEPIRADMTLVKVETTGATRYLGADDAQITEDLRVHWSRG